VRIAATAVAAYGMAARRAAREAIDLGFGHMRASAFVMTEGGGSVRLARNLVR